MRDTLPVPAKFPNAGFCAARADGAGLRRGSEEGSSCGMAEPRSDMRSASQTLGPKNLSRADSKRLSVLARAFVLLVGLAAAAFPLSAEPRDIGAYAVKAPKGSMNTWRKLVVAQESRCSPYDRDDYPYPSSVEEHVVDEIKRIYGVARIGRIYGPYSGRCFSSIRETDIEHIISLSEAHDSGLCAADAGIKQLFSADRLNLTIAAPELNRRQKSDKDAAQWLPGENQCWFAARVHAVRLKYRLTIDANEAAALEAVLSNCESTELIIRSCDWSDQSEQETVRPATTGANSGDPLELWDDNRNGRITCKEARRHGIAPVKRGHPAYQYMRDGDGDGWVCE